MDKHLTPVELQKIIKKNKRRSKKALFVFLEKNMNVVSVFYKEPQQEKKIFIAFDVVLNLNLLNEDSSDFNEQLFFQDLNMWRAPIKITKHQVEGAQIPNTLLSNNIQQQFYQNIAFQPQQVNLESASQSPQSPSQSHQTADNQLVSFFKEAALNNNFLVDIELDTQTTGMLQFSESTKILKSFSNSKANDLANHLVKYQDFVRLCLETYKSCETSMMRIMPNFKEENVLESMIDDANVRSLAQAYSIISEKIKNNKYVSYIIKINKSGQQLLYKIGYSRAFLDVMGICGNYEKFFMRRGPINPYCAKNRLDRLIKGLYHKSNGFYKKTADSYSDWYHDEDVHTLDNITFQCDFVNEKFFLNQSDQYYVKAGFLLQVSSYNIDEKTIDKIVNIRQKSGFLSQSQNSNHDNDFMDLQYTCESEMFINRFYA